MKEKIYLSGKITGDAGYREIFEAGVTWAGVEKR